MGCAIGRAECLARPAFVVTVRSDGGFEEHRACMRHLAWLVLYATLPGQSAVVGRLDG